jgi:hypothetical protein
MLDRIKFFGLVTLVTVLIWAFAESESLRTEKLALDLRLENAADRIVRVAPGQDWKGAAEATIEGSTAALSALKDALVHRPVTLAPGADLPLDPGDHPVDLRDVLRANSAFARRGVTITEVRPQNVLIIVDQLETRSVRVQVVVPDGEIMGQPEAVPATVKLSMPKADWAKLPPDPAVIARIDAPVLRSLPEGQRTTVPKVRLEPPVTITGAEVVSLNPESVDVTLTVQNRTAAFTLASVPVQIRIPAVETGRWDIEIPEEDQFLKDVVVHGTRDQIDQIRSGATKVIAFVPLTFDDLEAGATSKQAVFSELPTTLKFEAPNRTVRLTIKPRESGRPVPAGPAAGGP